MVIQIELIREKYEKLSLFNCTREPIIQMQGSGNIVLECVGSLLTGGIFNGAYFPTKPFVLDVNRIAAIRRFS